MPPKRKTPKKSGAADEIDISNSKFDIRTVRQTIRAKQGGEYYTGSKEITKREWWVLDEKTRGFVKKYFRFPESLRTAIDEPLTNARDQAHRYPNLTTTLEIEFDTVTGTISICNNGPGIPITKKYVKADIKRSTIEQVDERDMTEEQKLDAEKYPDRMTYLPEIICTMPQSGTNFDERILDRTTGGINGIGLKLTQYLSKTFTLTTISDNTTLDGSKKRLRYKQKFKNPDSDPAALGIVGEPKIEEVDKETDMYTKITFCFDYTLFGFREYSEDQTDLIETIYHILETRAYQLACACGVIVIFQGTTLEVNSPHHLSMLFKYDDFDATKESKDEIEQLEYDDYTSKVSYTDPVTRARIFGEAAAKKSKNLCEIPELIADFPNDSRRSKLYTWYVGVSMSARGFSQMTVMNGLYPTLGGTHVDFVVDEVTKMLANSFVSTLVYGDSGSGNRKDIAQHLESKRKMVEDIIHHHLSIVIIGLINKPSFPGQTKQSIQNNPESYHYTIEKSFGNALWEIMKDKLLNYYLDKEDPLSKKKKRVKQFINNIEEYEGARYAASKDDAKWKKTELYITEGKSAATFVSRMINSRVNPKLDADYCGLFPLKGMPINVRRLCTIINSKEGERYVLSDKLDENIEWNKFMEISGLDYANKYKSMADFRTLRYASLVLATDQDVDGKGGIRGMMVNNISMFWPNLIEKHQWVKALNTPIVRAIETVRVGGRQENIVEDFISMAEFREWESKHVNAVGKLPDRFEVNYCKGLATHSRDENKEIAKKKEALTQTYTDDGTARKHFDDYFGKDSDARKRILAVETDEFANDKFKSFETCDELLSEHVTEFQRANVIRKIADLRDGLIPTWRKIVWTAMCDVSRGKYKKPVDVNTYGAHVKEFTKYHHGETSMNNSIFELGQEWPDANLLPLILGSSISEFGTPKYQGIDHGSARYAKTKPHEKMLNAIFPELDKWLLKPKFEDGEECEPEYLAPIIPLVLFKFMHIPAHGWKVLSYPRDPIFVIDLLLQFIKGEISIDFDEPDVYKKLPKLPADTHGWKGTIKEDSKGREISIGHYKIVGSDKIVIDALPHQIGSFAYINGGGRASHKKEIMDKQKSEKKKGKGKEKSGEKSGEKDYDVYEKPAKKSAKKSAVTSGFYGVDLVSQFNSDDWGNEHEINISSGFMDDIDDIDNISNNGNNNDDDGSDSKDTATYRRMRLKDHPDIKFIQDKSYDDDSGVYTEIHVEFNPGVVSKIRSYYDKCLEQVANREKAAALKAKKSAIKVVSNVEICDDKNAYVDDDDDAEFSDVFRKNDTITISRENVIINDEQSTSNITIIDSDKKFSPIIDGLTEFLLLRRANIHHLNFRLNEKVKSFTDYREILVEWFKFRKTLYKKRKMRMLVIAKWEIIMLENQNRYSLEVGGWNGETIPQMESKLTEMKFPKLNGNLIKNPKIINVKKYDKIVCDEELGANYRYLLEFNAYQMDESAINKRKEQIKQLQSLLDDLENSELEKSFEGASMWYKELLNVKEIILRGFKEGWSYDQPKRQYKAESYDIKDNMETPVKKGKKNNKGDRSDKGDKSDKSSKGKEKRQVASEPVKKSKKKVIIEDE
jgi:DNA topoisomerase-2